MSDSQCERLSPRSAVLEFLAYVSTMSSLLSSLAEGTKRGSCQIFQKFMEKTDSRPMPDFDETSWCESIYIHWLKSEEDKYEESMIEQGVRAIKMA